MINPTHKTKKFFQADDGALIYALAIAVLLVLQFGVSIVITGYKGRTSEETFSLLQIFASLIFQAGYVAVYVLYVKKIGIKPTYRLKTPASPLWIAIGILSAILCLFCFYGIAALFDIWLKSVGYSMDSAFETNGIFQSILVIVVTVIAAPIGEELIFRSALLSGLKKNFNDTATALLCGLAFSFMHMNPSQTVYQFFLGFAAAYLVLSSGSVIPAMLIHAANNLIAVMASLFSPIEGIFIWYEKVFLGSDLIAVLTSLVFTAAGMAIIIFGCSFLKKYEYEKKKNKGIIPDEEIVTVLPYGGTRKGGKAYFIFLAVPFALTFLMWIFTFAAGVAGIAA